MQQDNKAKVFLKFGNHFLVRNSYFCRVAMVDFRQTYQPYYHCYWHHCHSSVFFLQRPRKTAASVVLPLLATLYTFRIGCWMSRIQVLKLDNSPADLFLSWPFWFFFQKNFFLLQINAHIRINGTPLFMIEVSSQKQPTPNILGGDCIHIMQ